MPTTLERSGTPKANRSSLRVSSRFPNRTARFRSPLGLSRTAEGIIKQNVAVSIAIKGLFVLLAPFGLVALWLAVLADMGTSIAVTLNGLRLFRKGGR